MPNSILDESPYIPARPEKYQDDALDFDTIARAVQSGDTSKIVGTLSQVKASDDPTAGTPDNTPRGALAALMDSKKLDANADYGTPTGGVDRGASSPTGGLGGAGAQGMGMMPGMGGFAPVRAFDADMAKRVAQMQMSRYRTPEQLEADKNERRGALAKLQEAQSMSSTPFTPAELFFMGMNTGPAANFDQMFSNGLTLANKTKMAQAAEQKANAVANAQSALTQANEEEKNTTAREKDADSGMSKVLSAEARGMGSTAMQQALGYYHIGKNLVHVQFNPDGSPGQVTPLITDTKVIDDIDKEARKFADTEVDKLGFNTETEDGRARQKAMWDQIYQAHRDERMIQHDVTTRRSNGQPTNLPRAMTGTPDGSAPAAGAGTAPAASPAMPAAPADGFIAPGLPHPARFQQYQDPSLHAAVMSWESNGNPNAVSSAGATTAMQVLKKTAAGGDPSLGLKGVDVNNPAAVEQFGHQYLDALVKKYGGDKTLALAAYNMGPGALDQWLASPKSARGLPAETQTYANGVLMNQAKINYLMSKGQQAPQAAPAQAGAPSTQADIVAPDKPQAPAAAPQAPVAGGAPATAKPQENTAPADDLGSFTAGPEYTPGVAARYFKPQPYPASYDKDALPKQVEQINTDNQKFLGDVNKRAGEAYDLNMMLDAIDTLRKTGRFDPGWGSTQMAQLGNVLTSLGLKNDTVDAITKKGVVTDSILRTINQAVGQKAAEIGGKETDLDRKAIQGQLMNPNDQAQVFDYTRTHMRELGNRTIQEANFAKDLDAQTMAAQQNGRIIPPRYPGIVNQWKNETMGPSYQNMPNGKGITRQQYVDDVADATAKKMTGSPNATIADLPRETRLQVQQMAAKKWRDLYYSQKR